jgi:hypothetical protein
MSTCLYLASGHAPAQVAASRRTSTDHSSNHHHHHHHHAADNGHAQDDEHETEAGEHHDPREAAAAETALAVAMAADEDSLHILVAELLKGLEDISGRGLGTAQLIATFAKACKQDLQPHADELLTVSRHRQHGWWQLMLSRPS